MIQDGQESTSLNAGCGATTTTATIYAIDSSHLKGDLPLCAKDSDAVNATQTLIF